MADDDITRYKRNAKRRARYAEKTALAREARRAAGDVSVPEPTARESIPDRETVRHLLWDQWAREDAAFDEASDDKPESR